jgi:CheY-like chemotaxis protein
MNGRRVAEGLREIRPRVPIIMLTGTHPILDEALRVNAWIVKGESEPDDLLTALTKLLNR